MALTRIYEALKTSFDDGTVNSPLEYKYVCQLKFVMSTIGSWPYKKFGRPKLHSVMFVYNFLLIAFSTTLCILVVIYVRQNMYTLSFFDMGHVILCWIFAVMYLLRLVTARTKKFQETIKEYLLEFHLFYFKNRSLYNAKVHAQIHTLSGIFTLNVIWEMFIGLTLFIFTPLHNNYTRGMLGDHPPENTTFEHSVYFYMPEFVFTTIEGYWILFALNIPISYVTTIGICVFDLLLCLIVFQIWGHLRILKHNLENMPYNRSGSMYSVEENVQVKMLLKKNILHHNLIIQFVDRCSDTFSEYLFAFYLLMQFITCILLLEVTTFTAESLAKYGPLTLGMHQQLIQVSILFEMINTKSEQLIDTVYAMPWERMDISNQKTVLFLMHRVQIPVSLKAAKVVPVGVNTMSAVLKTTFSYYMMLKTLAGDR
nr:odorant-receptor-2 [Grapholita molesta]